MSSRRFPPPWSVDDPNMKLGQDCFIVRDRNGHALAYEGVTCGTRARRSAVTGQIGDIDLDQKC